MTLILRYATEDLNSYSDARFEVFTAMRSQVEAFLGCDAMLCCVSEDLAASVFRASQTRRPRLETSTLPIPSLP